MIQLFENNDFKEFLFNSFTDKTSPKKLGKFRNLNKFNNQKICGKLDVANVQLANLEGLAMNSKFVTKIVNLKISIQADLQEINEDGEVEIQELQFASVSYFPRIQAAYVSLIGEVQRDINTVRMQCRESMHFRGIKFVNKSNIKHLLIEGQDRNRNNVNIKMENSNFDRISVTILNFADVQINKCSFLNSAFEGWNEFFCVICKSLIADKIKVQSIGQGVDISHVQNATMNKVEIFGNGEGGPACRLYYVPHFEINNAQIQNFEEGIKFFDSRGEIRNSDIKECQWDDIELHRSTVKYSNVQYEGITLDESSIFAQIMD